MGKRRRKSEWILPCSADPIVMHCSANRDLVNRWTQACEAPGVPWTRSGHTVVSISGGFLMFGGSADTENGDLRHTNDVWLYSPTSRRCRPLRCSGVSPSGRFGHSATVFPMDSGTSTAMVVHGGKEHSGDTTEAVNTTFVLAIGHDAYHWREAEVRDGPLPPIPRWGHSAVHTGDVPDSSAWSQVTNRNIESGMLVFGGDCGGAMMNDLMFLDVATETWLPLEAANDRPLARRNHTACTYGQHMYVFGGRSAEGSFLQDLWILALHSLTWRQVEPSGSIPAARTGHTAVMYQDRMIVFGGFLSPNPQTRVFFSDVHEYNTCNQKWAAITPRSLPTDSTSNAHGCTTPCMLPDRLVFRAGEDAPAWPTTHHCCSWSRPSPRSMSCSVVHGSRMYVFGGRDQLAASGGAFCLTLQTVLTSLRDLLIQWLTDNGLLFLCEDMPATIRERINELQLSHSVCMLCP